MNQIPVAILAATLSGAAIGFLPWNFNPARIFMGDLGAYFLGFCAIEFSQNDYSFDRRDKRFCDSPFVLPSLFKPQIKVIFAEDTSGSVSQELTANFRSQAKEIISSVTGEPTTHIEFDDCVQKVITEFDETTPNTRKGYGGTSFASVFSYIQENIPECTGLVLFTDGYCGDFGQIFPNYPVVWAVPETHKESLTNWHPPFGRILWID